ncbi:hypothetical protein NIES932_06330 [Raphidiopsis curvata NIES-932]|nr:hypothetical protein NIES932_06330 [Raphidiopsis curvata NIES-932]
MLKPKSLIFTLSLVPFLLASLQLTSEGGSTTPGGPSGNVLPSPPSIPLDPDSVQTQPGGNSGPTVTFIPNTESIILTGEGQSATLAVTQEVQAPLNQLVPGILEVLGGSADTADVVTLLLARPGATEAAAKITTALTSAGISLERATTLVTALNGLFSPSTAYSPGYSRVQAQLGAILVGNKDWKGNNTVAQAGAAFSVNIDKLSAAINAYNGIVIESKPPTLKRLSQDESFLGIGRTLKQLRNAIP